MKLLKTFAILLIVVAAFGGAMFALDLHTGPIIEANNAGAAFAPLLAVMPNGTGFEELDVATLALPATVTNVYKETSDNGYVFRVTANGYKPGLVVMCGIDAEGKVVGTKCIETQDTFGKEPELDNTYNGQTLEGFTPNMISGATMTSGGYRDAVKTALQAFVIVGGGEVDLRTPEQILNDNCNAALGTENKTFTKWFAVEELADIDAIYVAEGTDGAVISIGEIFVGVGADGKAIAAEGADADAMAKAEAAYAVYGASVLTALELPEGASNNVLGVWQTESGNYVFELQAAGYGINGEYVASGEYIKLKVAITAEGKIISTLTTYENETDGIGDVCANPEYYEQFNGTDKDSYASVENKTGATVTTSAYKGAIKLAFTTLDLIKGGVQ